MSNVEKWEFERAINGFGWTDFPVAEPETTEKFTYVNKEETEFFLWKPLPVEEEIVEIPLLDYSAFMQPVEETPYNFTNDTWFEASGDPVVSLGIDFENFNIPLNVTRYFDGEQNKGY